MKHGTAPLALVVALPALALAQSTQDAPVSDRARRLHERAIVVDTHDDTTQRLVWEKTFDIAARNPEGSVDIPRMREGGLDAIFFSIWMPGDVTGPAAVKRALDQIDAVREAVRTHPNDLVLATSAAEIRRAAAAHKIAALMGVEGGHMIDEDLGVLRAFHALGVRYLTLTHALNTPWADSSGEAPAHGGLTPFGKDVVRELNRLGVMVDVSHVSDKTFFDALATSRAPLIASHSSARAISNAPRNMTDAMLRAISGNGGVVMVNYSASYLSQEYRDASRGPEQRAQAEAISRLCGADEACRLKERGRRNQEAMRAGRLPMVSWERIVDHIEHVRKIAGIDHVGLGSDFDGTTLPIGMEDASKLPKITEALLGKGYSEEDVLKVLGGNVLRVMERVEALAGSR